MAQIKCERDNVYVKREQAPLHLCTSDSRENVLYYAQQAHSNFESFTVVRDAPGASLTHIPVHDDKLAADGSYQNRGASFHE